MSTRILALGEVIGLIEAGRTLSVGGDEALLRQLPPGRWTGGTVPYYMGEDGCRFSRDRLAVTVLPEDARLTGIRAYDSRSLRSIFADEPEHGFSLLIMPMGGKTLETFAGEVPLYPELRRKPLIGWVSGMALEEIGLVKPLVFDGERGGVYEDAAVVMHVELPAGKRVQVGVVNPFQAVEDEVITFEKTSWVVDECLVNGWKANFADYLLSKKADTRVPLIADYEGTRVNCALQGIDLANHHVRAYGPLFRGVTYRLGKPIADYVQALESAIASQQQQQQQGEPVFACNCLLNYLYGSLEGRRTGPYVGPMTYGEIAYQLQHQTLVHMSIVDGD